MTNKHWESRLLLTRPGQEGGQYYAQVLVDGPEPQQTPVGCCECTLCMQRKASPIEKQDQY